MKKVFSIFAILVGLILFIVGLTIKIPSKELTTYSILSDDYSVIDEYVGGDAYNYIIGASLVGGEIAGAKSQKAIFISMGSLISVIGLLAYSFSKENIKKPEKVNVSLSTGDNIDDENNNDTKTSKTTIVDNNL